MRPLLSRLSNNSPALGSISEHGDHKPATAPAKAEDVAVQRPVPPGPRAVPPGLRQIRDEHKFDSAVSAPCSAVRRKPPPIYQGLAASTFQQELRLLSDRAQELTTCH